MPVGAKPFDREAVSVTGFPTSTAPEATVEMAGRSGLTVTTSTPRPTTFTKSGPWTWPSTRADEAVCTPGAPDTSREGILRTSKENSILQSLLLPRVDSTTSLDGVNVTIPVSSGELTANGTPWQAPAVPTAAGARAKTPGSGDPHGTSMSPHDGHNRMAVSSSGPGGVRSDRLIENVPGRPVSRTVTGSASRGVTMTGAPIWLDAGGGAARARIARRTKTLPKATTFDRRPPAARGALRNEPRSRARGLRAPGEPSGPWAG